MGYGKNKLLEYFDEIERQLDFGLWFSGHYHLDKIYDKRHVLIYDSIVKLTDTGFEQICPK